MRGKCQGEEVSRLVYDIMNVHTLVSVLAAFPLSHPTWKPSHLSSDSLSSAPWQLSDAAAQNFAPNADVLGTEHISYRGMMLN